MRWLPSASASAKTSSFTFHSQIWAHMGRLHGLYSNVCGHIDLDTSSTYVDGALHLSSKD